MERRFNRTHHYANQNNNILPVSLYLTLPTINLHRNTSLTNNKKVKHQKQKQRDFERMKQFNQQKTVCSVFPFYQLENDDIQNMVTRPTPVQFSKTNPSLEKTKMCNLQEENDKLTLLNTELKDKLKTINETLVCQIRIFSINLTKKKRNSMK